MSVPIATTEPSSPPAAPDGASGVPSGPATDFDAYMSRAGEAATAGQPPASGGGAQPPATTPATQGEAPLDEAALQQQMFENFTEGVEPEVQERLSEWLPDVLDGGKKELKKAAKDLSKQEAKDLNALAKAIDEKGGFETDESKSNRKGLENLKQEYGEFSLKTVTPQLAPAVSYDSDPTIKDTRDAVYDKFVSDVSKSDLKRLDDVLPDVLFNKKSAEKAAEKLSDKEVDALKELAKEHGVELPPYEPRSDFSSSEQGHYKVSYEKRVKLALLEGLETEFKRDLALETTAELPTVADMLLVEKFGEDNGDTAAHIHLKDDNILKEAKAFKKEFGDLDAWLPDVLAGRGDMPAVDKGEKKLLVEFAEEFGFDPKKGDDLGERVEKALKFLDKQDVIGTSLHPGKTGKDTAFLLFTDRFMESTLAYGAKNEALDQGQLLDAANVAEMLLGPDDGTETPRELEIGGLQAAILHRTDKDLARPQEVMAATGYINSAETLAEQKTRLTEVVLAFHVREEIGTPPMTPLQWAKNYADLHPEMLDDLGNRAFNSPTGEKLQIITAHLGVPGEHKFMVDKKRKIKMEVDQAGNLDHFDVDKKKKSFFKKLIDVAVPVISAALTMTGVGAGVAAVMNVAYGMYKGVEAIKHGDLLGGLVGVAGAMVPGGSWASKGVQFASGALKTIRAIENKDWMGAFAGGLGTVSSGLNMGPKGLQPAAANLNTVANGVNTAQSLKEGDFLQASAGLAGMAGNAAAYNNASVDTQFALQGLEQGLNLADGIQEENYAGIGNAAAGLITTSKDYHDYQEAQTKLPPMTGVSIGPDDGVPAFDENGRPIILQANYANPDGTPATNSIEVASGDTLSQIAERHGTTVEALMAANPGLTDANTIHAGQQLTLPEGVQPVGAEQQERLQEFADSQGGSPILPSPPRPGQGDPSQQPGATHPNEGGAADARERALEAYKRDFDQALDKELSSIDEKIAEIDQQLAEGVAHAPVKHLLDVERLKLQAQQRSLQEIADDPNAAFEALKAKIETAGAPNDEGWTASDIGHAALDIIGVAPVVGEWADMLNAAWYFSKGDIVNGSLSASSSLMPGADIGLKLGKWLNKVPSGTTKIQEIPPSQLTHQELLDGVDGLDVATGKNQAVFYSGKGAHEAATTHAKENGLTTLNQTNGGHYLEGLSLSKGAVPDVDEAQALKIWERLSTNYASQVSGDVTAIVNNPKPKSVFLTQELPTLLKNPNVTQINVQSISGSQVSIPSGTSVDDALKMLEALK